MYHDHLKENRVEYISFLNYILKRKNDLYETLDETIPHYSFDKVKLNKPIGKNNNDSEVEFDEDGSTRRVILN
jgi:hypothetical protein